MVTAGTVDQTAYKALPPVPGSGALQLPTVSQQSTAGNVVAQQWPSVTS